MKPRRVLGLHFLIILTESTTGLYATLKEKDASWG
jgi:hypothetical protein